MVLLYFYWRIPQSSITSDLNWVHLDWAWSFHSASPFSCLLFIPTPTLLPTTPHTHLQHWLGPWKWTDPQNHNTGSKIEEEGTLACPLASRWLTHPLDNLLPPPDFHFRWWQIPVPKGPWHENTKLSPLGPDLYLYLISRPQLMWPW